MCAPMETWIPVTSLWTLGITPAGCVPWWEVVCLAHYCSLSPWLWAWPREGAQETALEWMNEWTNEWMKHYLLSSITNPNHQKSYVHVWGVVCVSIEIQLMKYSWPSVSTVLYWQIQPTGGQKYSGEKKNSRRFQKVTLKFAVWLATIYIAFTFWKLLFCIRV